MNFTLIIDSDGVVTRVETANPNAPATKAELMRQVRRIKETK